MAYLDENYWSHRYLSGKTGWNIGYASYPLAQYLDQIGIKDVEILIPGGGNGYEAAYAYQNGFQNVHLLDFSKVAIKNFQEKFPDFPSDHIHLEDFFSHSKQYDLVLEQTFFCALNPNMRKNYVEKMLQLLKPGGKIAGVLFNREFEKEGPPFGGTLEEYLALFSGKFEEVSITPCYNSIPERQGSEYFISLKKSDV